MKAAHIAGFIEPMQCLPVTKIPEGPTWTYEIKWDGYRLEVVRSTDAIALYSRRKSVLNKKFPLIARELATIPNGTVLDGELVALDESGRPNFNLLQNYRSAESYLRYYVFDILVHENRDLTQLPLSTRRAYLRSVVKPTDHIDISEVTEGYAAHMVRFVKEHGLEGIVAKRSDSVYQPGKRTGLWAKHRFDLEKPFVIGGFIPSDLGVDSLIVGYYRGKDLYYAGRVRAGFIPATRREVFSRIKHFITSKCPFSNLPESGRSHWGEGLNAEKMKECIWLRPEAVAQVKFLEWTGADHLRHTKFAGLRDDIEPRNVIKLN